MFFRRPVPGSSFSTEIPSPSPSSTLWPCNGDTWARRNGHFKGNTSHPTRVLCGPQRGAHRPGHRRGEGWTHLPAIGSWTHACFHPDHCLQERSQPHLESRHTTSTVPQSDGNPKQTSMPVSSRCQRGERRTKTEARPAPANRDRGRVPVLSLLPGAALSA